MYILFTYFIKNTLNNIIDCKYLFQKFDIFNNVSYSNSNEGIILFLTILYKISILNPIIQF